MPEDKVKFLECLGYITLASVQTLFLLLSMHLQLIYYSGKRVIGKRIELVFPYFVPLLLINQYSVVVAAVPTRNSIFDCTSWCCLVIEL